MQFQAPDIIAIDAAADLLGLFETELHADIEDTDWRHGKRQAVTTPVLIQLDGLEVELTTDGNEVQLRRVAGSGLEFEELCSFIVEHRDCA